MSADGKTPTLAEVRKQYFPLFAACLTLELISIYVIARRLPGTDAEAPADETAAVVEELEAEETNSAEEENNEASEETDEKPEITIETAPADFRFPTTNQSRHCFTRYVEYHRCVAAKGEDAPECEKFAKYYRSLCPGEWVDRWNEQRENGTFAGPL
ncbi:unnamed protein product [Alopecurus aequalis]